MMYAFMTLDDSAEIVHSEMRPDGTVKVYVESRTRRTASTMAPAFSPATNGRMFPA